MKLHLGCALLLVWTLAAPQSSAQAPSTAASDSPENAHPDYSGTWTLDRSISNDPTQARFDAGSQGQGANRPRAGFGGGGFGGSFGGGGFGRGGGGRNNGSGTRESAKDTATADEKARLAALTDELKTGSATLIISHHDPDFVVNDALNHAFFLHTTASRDDHPLGALTITSTTHWEGDRIVAEYAVSDRRTLVYTYTLLPKTHQMVLRVRAQFNDVSSANIPELKLVYTLTPSREK